MLTPRVQKIFLLYDSECRICTALRNVVRLLDLRGCIVTPSLRGRQAILLLRGMDDRMIMRSFHVVTESGRIASGEKAIPLLLNALPHGNLLARAMVKSNLATGIISRIFRGLVRGRMVLSCSNICLYMHSSLS